MTDRRRFLLRGGLRALALAGLPWTAAWLQGGCASPAGPPGGPAAPTPTPPLPADAAVPDTPLSGPARLGPPLPREFRGAWVATVDNIDWPSRRDLSTAEQQAEALALLDTAARLRLNAIVLQVRPAADALYPSALEPWSEYLTGLQGRAPAPAWDPLAFWVAEAHRRGIELHAWFNPYRARHATARGPLAAGHIARRQPDAVVSYGEQLWLDPGNARAMQHSLDVIADVATRYDIDGVHIDDYFYPYPIEAPNSSRGDAAVGGAAPRQWVDFPDERSWAAYHVDGGPLGRADWRRQNVDRFVTEMFRRVRAIKPWLKVGISPFGLGRPDRRPEGISGFSQYDQLYANVERWLDEGWLDYLVPQLYWPIDQRAQAFDVLYRYWRAQNPRQRAVWPGLFTSRVGAPQKPWSASEIVAQVALSRRIDPAGGHVHFSLVALAQDRDGIASVLSRTLYAEPALPPAMPWLDAAAAPAPQFAVDADGRVTVAALPAAGLRLALWLRERDTWRLRVLPVDPGRATALPAPPPGEPARYVASVINRAGIEGPRASWPGP